MPEENITEVEEFKPITSQDELNKLIGSRIGAVRSQYADYDDLKNKAAEYDKAQEASKSELQKERERAEAAEKRAGAAERAAVQARVASELGVPVEVVHGDTEEQMRASAQKVIEWRDGGKKKPPPPKGLNSG